MYKVIKIWPTVIFIAIGLASCNREPDPVPPASSASKPASSIDADVLEILSKQLNVKSGEIKLTHTFKDLAMDDLDVVEVTMALEDHFHIRIPDDIFVSNQGGEKKYPKMTVGDLCNIVRYYQKVPYTRPAPTSNMSSFPSSKS